MLHSILTFLVNIFIYTAVLCIWIAIIFAVFKIKPNRYLPFGWIGIATTKIFKPLFILLGKGLLYLSKVFLKWLVFTLEQLWYFIREIIGKLFELITNPNDS